MNRSWERQPGEPAHWYDRFRVYCNLGPNRTLSAAYRQVAQRDGLKTPVLPAYWRKQAERWQWHARAAAWDAANHPTDDAAQAHEQEGGNGSRLGAGQRRSMVEQLLATVFAVLVQADFDGMSSYEVRRALPTLRLFFKDLLAAHRLEVDDGVEDGDVPPFTADELRAAQESLAEWQASWPTRSQYSPSLRSDAGTRWLPLRDVLAQLYPDEAGARRVAAQGGLDGSKIAFGPRAVDSWHAILTEAIHARRLAAVAGVALREYAGHPGLWSAISQALDKLG